MTEAMKYAALSWLRYTKNCDIVCTEVGTHYLKDVFGLHIGQDGLPSLSIEIEVKNSLADLSRDFSAKKRKHAWYAEGRDAPNYMYFLVPKSLVEKSSVFLRNCSQKYGLLSFDSEAFLNSSRHPFSIGTASISSVLRVTKLTTNRPKPSVLYQCGRRLMNEYFIQRHLISQNIEGLERQVETYAREIVKYERGRERLSFLNDIELLNEAQETNTTDSAIER